MAATESTIRFSGHTLDKATKAKVTFSLLFLHSTMTCTKEEQYNSSALFYYFKKSNSFFYTLKELFPSKRQQYNFSRVKRFFFSSTPHIHSGNEIRHLSCTAAAAAAAKKTAVGNKEYIKDSAMGK